MRTQWGLNFVFQGESGHFLPEFIADLPLVARHTSPSKIAIIFDLTIPFGIGSKYVDENHNAGHICIFK